jgi:predicted naringenin-chalcone synthase
MWIAGIGTAVPPHRYAQTDCWKALKQSAAFQNLSSRSQAILKKVLLGSNGISARHLALNPLEEAFDLQPDRLHSRFLENAPALAAEAARNAMHRAALNAADVDAILISTCTGYLCPGLTSYVIQRLGLRSDVLALDLVGQGCGAALPNLQTATALLDSRRAKAVLSVCVEVCSAAFFLDDDPGVLISACIFGDGAGAAVLTAESRSNRSFEIQAAQSIVQPANRDQLRFEHRNGMLRNILKPEVPGMAAAAAAEVFEKLLAQTASRRDQIRGWVLHPGGRDVLSALEQSLKLTPHDTRWSAQILNEHGNLSSASLYFVLERALSDGAEPGLWFMSSFGAGFSCHGALARFRDGREV